MKRSVRLGILRMLSGLRVLSGLRIFSTLSIFSALISLSSSHITTVCAEPQSAPSEAQASAADSASAQWRELRDADLEPINLGQKSDQVRRAIKRRSWTEAARAITTQGAPQSLLRAWLYTQAEAWERVIKHARDVEKDELLSDEGLMLKLGALMKLERFEDAEETSTKISRIDLGLWRSSLRLRAQALRKLERWDEAIQAYQELLKSPDLSERQIGALGRAMVAIERGDSKRGLELLRVVYVEHSGSWVAGQASRQANQLIALSPELKSRWSTLSLEERLVRIEGLLERGSSAEALKLLPTLQRETLSEDQRCRAAISLGRAHDKRRDRAKALKALEAGLELCHKLKHARTPLGLYVAGRAASYTNQREVADRHFKRLLNDYQHRLSDDAAVFMIRHALKRHQERHPDSHKVAALMKRSQLSKSQRKSLRRLQSPVTDQLKQVVQLARRVVELHPHGDLTSEAVTFALIGVLRAGHLKLARELIKISERLPHRAFRFHDAGRALYWSGRIAALSGDRERARALYERVLVNAPVSWYALMAYSRLHEWSSKRAVQSLKSALTWRPKGLTLPGGAQEHWRWRLRRDDPHWTMIQRALMWMRLGLMKRGRRAFRELSGEEVRPDLKWFSAWALDGYQQHHWSHDILRRQLIEYRSFPPYRFHFKHWMLAYPAPHDEAVRSAAKAEGVDAQFIWGVMREESGYAPQIRSSASAVGLLQLILTTAKMMSRADEPEVTLARLGIPEVNIPLGARYLAWVKRKLSCAWSLVPAGYNAGANALKRWIRARGHLPLDMFVETLPYEEARWYTKRVNASWITFRTLYGAPQGQPLWPYVSQRVKVSEDNPTVSSLVNLKPKSKQKRRARSRKRKRKSARNSRRKSKSKRKIKIKSKRKRKRR